MNRPIDHIVVEVKGVYAILRIKGIEDKITVYAKDWFQYASPNSKILLQDAFPYLTVKSRKIIKTGTYIELQNKKLDHIVPGEEYDGSIWLNVIDEKTGKKTQMLVSKKDWDKYTTTDAKVNHCFPYLKSSSKILIDKGTLEE